MKAAASPFVVISVAPQVRASLALRYNLTLVSTMKKLTFFFKKYFRAHSVFDTAFSRYLSLLEMEKEFFEKWEEGKDLPLLSSACPGWICYAEKRHGDYVLPHISRVSLFFLFPFLSFSNILALSFTGEITPANNGHVSQAEPHFTSPIVAFSV